MALTKPPVLPAWAESGDKTQPSSGDIQIGWPLSNVPPSRQRFNWLLNFLSNGVRYLTRRGIADYGADETYMVGDRAIGDDGKTYRSIQDNNIGHTPSTSLLWWERWGYTTSELQEFINSKEPTIIVRAASTVPINIASPGAVIDDVTMVVGDTFLEKDNGTGAARGIYVWNGASVSATRAPAADTSAELLSGMMISVAEGTTNADTVWLLTTDGVITLGVTSLSFILVNINSGFAKTNAVQTFTKAQRGAVVNLVSAAGSIAVDLALANNYSHTLTENTVLAAPTNAVEGQSGYLFLQQHATAAKTLAYNTFWKFPGGLVPSLTTTLGAIDVLVYSVDPGGASATCQLLKDRK